MDKTQQVTALLNFGTEELSLSKHYEQIQYNLLISALAIVTLSINFKGRIGDLAGSVARANFTFSCTAIIVIAISVLALRYCALAVLSFHSGMTYRNVARAVAADMPYAGSPNPFLNDYRDFAFIKMPKRAGQIVNLLASDSTLLGFQSLLAGCVILLLGLVVF